MADDRANDENEEEADDIAEVSSANLRRTKSVPGATKGKGILSSLAEKKQMKSDPAVPTLGEPATTKRRRVPSSLPNSPSLGSDQPTAQVCDPCQKSVNFCDADARTAKLGSIYA